MIHKAFGILCAWSHGDVRRGDRAENVRDCSHGFEVFIYDLVVDFGKSLCFDYYVFGRTDVKCTAQSLQAVPSIKANFSNGGLYLNLS
jgi:hypothetical protein